MKNKLIAMLLASTLIGGVGVTAGASENASQSNCTNTQNTCFQRNSNNLFAQLCGNKPCYNLQDAMQQLLIRCGLLNSNNCNFDNQYDIFGVNKNDCQISTCNEQGNSAEYQKPTDNDTQGKDEPVKGAEIERKPVAIEETSKTSEHKTKKEKHSKTTNKTNNEEKTTSNQEVNSNDNFMAQVESRIFEKVNEERSKAGLSTLSRNNTMDKYARIKSQDMGDKNYFNHTDLQGNYITAKMANDGVRYNSWGENIAYISGVSDPNALADQFMRNWMNSPGHRANILSSNFASLGVGVYKTGNTVYATQEFYR